MIKYLPLIFLVGCGYSSKNSETLAQVKYIQKKTPLICPDMVTIGLSLGVMVNSKGSMSTHDVEVTTYDSSVLETLQRAAKNGDLVELVFQQKRWSWCNEITEITKVHILGEK